MAPELTTRQHKTGTKRDRANEADYMHVIRLEPYNMQVSASVARTHFVPVLCCRAVRYKDRYTTLSRGDIGRKRVRGEWAYSGVNVWSIY